MFKKLEIGNFKRFEHAQINLAKINIIVGPNNSGKSSIISAFRLLNQTLESYDDQVQLLLNGPFGDFGTYKDIIYKNHRGKPLELSFEIDILNIFNDNYEVARFDLVFKYSQEEREIYTQNVKISIDGRLLIEAKYSLESKKFIIEKIGGKIIPSSLKSILSKEFRVRHFFPVPISSRLGYFDKSKKNVYQDFAEEFNASEDAYCLRALIRLWNGLTREISKTDCLGPLRTAPSRTYLFTGERSKRIGISGENLTSILATNQKRKTRAESTINEKINEWLCKSEMAKDAKLVPLSDRHFEIRIKNFFTGESQNIADVGYGHSQVIPFLAGGYALSSGGTYFSEQPELHLHPKAQAELGSFIFDMYQSKVQTLIETHSEHLILRLQQYVASGEINNDDIRIFYVGNSKKEEDISVKPKAVSEITVINLDKKGHFIEEWPKGFFPEKLNESKKLAKIRLMQHGL